MTALADYRCSQCGLVFELPNRGEMMRHEHNQLEFAGEGDIHHAVACDSAYVHRVWTAPHLGRGSGGEPPR